ncbi:MAG: hypothetical protein AAF702_51040 [Chloroflexota bacterium]
MTSLQIVPQHRSTTVSVTQVGSNNPIRLPVGPQNAVCDANGYIRVWSVPYDDNTYRNLVLAPLDIQKAQLVHLVTDWLLPFGLSYASGKFIQISDNAFVDNLAKYMISKFASELLVKPATERWQLGHSGYYESESGILMIDHTVRIAL